MYHVTSRGVRKADVFTDVRDRLRFQQIFQNVVERHTHGDVTPIA